MRLDELRRWAAGQLDGFDSPQTEAWAVLEANGITRTRVLSHPEEEADMAVLSSVRQMVGERKKHVPLSYITHHKEFFALDFIVSGGTLIPRPDTEILVEKVIELARGRRGLKVLDLCTGTGCVGLALQTVLDVKHLVLADISPEALEVARQNAARLAVTEVEIIQSDLFSAIGEDLRFDIIVSNPPYIAHKWEAGLSEEVRKEPRLALLDEEEDGTGILKSIIASSFYRLEKNGILALECDFRQAGTLICTLTEAGYSQAGITKDLAGLDRVVSALRI